MEDDILDEEFSIMYRETDRIKVLDSRTFLKPIKNLRVRKPLTLQSRKSAHDALDLLQAKHATCLLIIQDQKLVGILTERDLITKALPSGKPLNAIFVDDIMTRNPESFQADDSIAFVLNAMHVGGYRHVPVVDDRNHPLAIVSVRDIMGFIVEHFSEEILNLPPRAPRRMPTQDGG